MILTGLRTPDRANLAKFVSEFSDFHTAVTQDYMERKKDYYLEGKTRSDKAIYYAIASGDWDNVNQNPPATGKVADLNSELSNVLPEGLTGEDYYEITSDLNVTDWKKNSSYYEARGTEEVSGERHYVTDTGEVFILPGYRVEENGTTKWYLNEKKYYTSDEPIHISEVIEQEQEGTILVANGTTRATTTRIRYISDLSKKEENEIEITKDNAGNYYGLVVDYTPQSTQIEFTDGTTDPVSSVYRLFYIDFDNKYQEGENTIFLKADPPTVDHIGQYHMQEQNYSEDDTRIEQFNSTWKEYDGTIDTNGERRVAWMCDPTKWTGCLDAGGKAKYAIGGVSTDMLIDSWASTGLGDVFDPSFGQNVGSKFSFPYRYHNEILYTPHATQYNLAGFWGFRNNVYPAFVYCDTLGTLGADIPNYLAEDEAEAMTANGAVTNSSYIILETDDTVIGAYSPCVVLKRGIMLNCNELNGIEYPDSITQEQHDYLIIRTTITVLQ